MFRVYSLPIGKFLGACLAPAAALTAGGAALLPTVAQADAAAPPSTEQMRCDDSIKTLFKPDAETSVIMVHQFRKGAPLQLAPTRPGFEPFIRGRPDGQIRIAQHDLCMVKLMVGPGNPGPEGAPSTSKGIGIEIWLPSPENWNSRIHVFGGGGMDGSAASSTIEFNIPGQGVAGMPYEAADGEGAVSASSDTGHFFDTPLAGINASFGLLPDGSINRTLWHDNAMRSMHELALKTKALTQAYYGRAARYAYFDGFSSGGRQAMMIAQAYPHDFDGILAGAPAMNLMKFLYADIYGQVVTMNDLGGKFMSAAQLSAVSQAAIASCDVVGGVHMGYLVAPETCRYDPVRDKSVLCAADGGDGDPGTCLSRAQAVAVNKMWYGPTSDGSVPDPVSAQDMELGGKSKRLWFGFSRGDNLAGVGGENPFSIAVDLLAIEMGDPSIGSPVLTNATGNGTNGWKKLTYRDLAGTFAKVDGMQEAFSHLNTDNPDLSAFKAAGNKLILYHGLADTVIPWRGSVKYYNDVIGELGGLSKVQQFFRLYLVPGMAHSFINGTANPAANMPMPEHGVFYRRLTDWVENHRIPDRIDIANGDAKQPRSWPLCVFPAVARLRGQEAFKATSYECSVPAKGH